MSLWRVASRQAMTSGRPALLMCLLALTGCASMRLNSARDAFYAGDLSRAASDLEKPPSTSQDEVLFLMERGMVLQARQDYKASVMDFLHAQEKAEELDYLSVTKTTASFLTNDRMLAYRGEPFERTLLHAFAANNYLAMAMWDDAAVEGRNVIDRLEHLNGFPDDPYSRYMAAFCLELQGDSEGAAFQYKAVSQQVKTPPIDERTGRFGPTPPKAEERELVCFVGIGRAPTEDGYGIYTAAWGPSPYAEIYDGDRLLGRSYTLDTTYRLANETEKRLATLKVVKTVSRIVVKEVIAESVSRKNEALGALLWLVLFSTEGPDTRRWETLPGWLQVARVPCPADLTQYRVVFRSTNGAVLRQKTVQVPLARRGSVFVSFCRDVP